MKKIIVSVALLAALFSAQAQNQNPIYIGNKCPDCLKWQYERSGWVETLTNPELKTWVKIDWVAKKVTVTDGTSYPLEFTTQDHDMSQTYWYGGQKLVVFFNKRAEYVGHRVED